MSAEEEIRKALLESTRVAQGHIDHLRGLDTVTWDDVNADIRGFIFARFMVTAEEAQGLGFMEIAELSIAKSAEITRGALANLERTKGCRGASSASVKRSLMFKNIDKRLELDIDPGKAFRVKTLEDVTDAVFDAMQKSDLWASRLA